MAAEYLRGLGWPILSRNFTCPCAGGELDIIAIDKDENELVAVEVRCRTLGEVQSPADSIGPKKLKSLIQAGSVYVEQVNWQGPWRIDLIGITASHGYNWPIEHVRGITDS
jgi:putative endonuclease